MCDFKSLLETAHNPRNRVNQAEGNQETYDRDEADQEPNPPRTFRDSVSYQRTGTPGETR